MFELKNVVELKELFIAKRLHNLHNQQKEVPWWGADEDISALQQKTLEMLYGFPKQCKHIY